MNRSHPASVLRLDRGSGTIAYTDRGAGPLIIAAPGMGDLRSTFDAIAPSLLDAGARLVVMDLRGHGDSDTGFAELGDEATASDFIALVEHFAAGPAVLLGSSMAGAAALVAAAERPELVRAVVTVGGPFRAPEGTPGWVVRLMLRVMLARPWGARAWGAYYRSINRGRRPPRVEAQVAAVRASLRDPARLREFRRLGLALDHAVVERRLGEVRAPVLAIFGALDPDFPDPEAEAAFAHERVGAVTRMIPETGHYPQLQDPESTAEPITAFLADRGIIAGDIGRVPSEGCDA